MLRCGALGIFGFLLVCVSSYRVNVKDQLYNSRPSKGDASSVFSQLAELQANSAQVPGSNTGIMKLGQLVMQIVNMAKVSPDKRHQAVALRGNSPYESGRNVAYGALYGVEGMPFDDYIWQVEKGDVDMLANAAIQSGLTLRKVHVVMSRMGKFKDLHHDSFWFAVAGFTDVSSGRSLFVVSSRGSQGISEWIADIGLFEADVKSQLDFSTWAAFGMVKTILKSKSIGQMLGSQIPDVLQKQMGLELADEVKNDEDQLQAMVNFNRTTVEFANTLLDNVERFSKSLREWSTSSETWPFGGWNWDKVDSGFLTSGLSLGGAVATMVGMHLKLQFEGSGPVAGFSMNSPGVRKLLLRKLPEEQNNILSTEFQEKVKSSDKAGSGFVNLVTQHDIIWKIGEQIGAGQKVCMYMHPAEDFGCKTGDDKFKKWSQLSDAISIHCANGVGDSGSMSKLWYAGVKIGMHVFTDLWKCTELFSSPEEVPEGKPGKPGCWPLEHNFAFGGSADPFEKPTKTEQVPLRQLMQAAGETKYLGNTTTNTSVEARFSAELAAEVAKIKQKWEIKSPSGCIKDASSAYCVALDSTGKSCKYKDHGNSSAERGSARTPCEAAESTKVVRQYDARRRCECATGYCFHGGKCVSGPDRDQLSLEVEIKKKIRATKRTMLEGTLDADWNYKWVCNSE